jgi:hypothetical protein
VAPGAGFAAFAGLFEGGRERVGGWAWFFDGENVVKCVVIVV